jgi:hypothetical protein
MILGSEGLSPSQRNHSAGISTVLAEQFSKDTGVGQAGKYPLSRSPLVGSWNDMFQNAVY